MTRSERLPTVGYVVSTWPRLSQTFVLREILAVERLGVPVRIFSAKDPDGEPSHGDVAHAARITLCYGARTAEYFAGIEDFERLRIDVRLATDDGSRGYHGLVTDVLDQVLKKEAGPARIVCCGPEPMMEAAARLACAAGAACEVSLETPMACGIGICFTCVTKVRQPEPFW